MSELNSENCNNDQTEIETQYDDWEIDSGADDRQIETQPDDMEINWQPDDREIEKQHGDWEIDWYHDWEIDPGSDLPAHGSAVLPNGRYTAKTMSHLMLTEPAYFYSLRGRGVLGDAVEHEAAIVARRAARIMPPRGDHNSFFGIVVDGELNDGLAKLERDVEALETQPIQVPQTNYWVADKGQDDTGMN